jgi:thymidylate kinase
MSRNTTSPGAVLISFSGIDGAGKSTQIGNLCEQFAAAGLRVQIITFWDDVVRLKSFREEVGHKVFRGDRGVGTPAAPIVRRDKNVRSPLVTLFRLCVYVLDALSLKLKAARAERSGADIVIFDRFLYDELANLDLNRAAIRIYVRLLLRIVPKPHMAFVLDANPAEAFTRKPEYPLEFLHSNRNAYLRLAQITNHITVIPPLPLDAAMAEVTRMAWSTAHAHWGRSIQTA